MRGEKDRSGKWLLQSYGDCILSGLARLTERIVSWKPLQAEVVQPKQLPDGVLEVLLAGQSEPDRFLIEIATYPEKRVSEQMLRDSALVYLDRRKLPEAVTLVLHPRGKAEVSGVSEEKSRLGWTGWRLSWRVINLWEIPAAQLLARGEVGLMPWVPLARLEGPAEPVLRECRRRIDELAPTRDRPNLLAVAQVLGRLRYDLPTLAAIFGEKQSMIESPLIEELLADPEVIKASPVHQKTLAEIREGLVRVLSARFGTLPDELIARLSAITTSAPLTALFEWAALCKSLDEFRSRLTP